NTMIEKLGLLGLFIGCLLSATIIPFSSEALVTGALLLDYSPWTIILVGAGMAYSIQNVKNFEYELEVTQLSTGLKTKLALLILHSITKQFKNELPPQTSLEISESIDLPHRITKMILTTMTNAGLIHEVKTDDEKTFATPLRSALTI
ncbi:MAG: hypothetical protein II663_07365, partial [Bacteroidales bacterium]|nr:hypothetical protein [Bacteroidales bacterium]